jgi:hypothetical protein
MDHLIQIGCDIGQKSDNTAIVMAEQTGDRYVVRNLERLPLGTPYPAVAERIGEVWRAAVERAMGWLYDDETRERGHLPENLTSLADLQRQAANTVFVLIDATGCGLPVVDFVREHSGIPDDHLTAVMFTAGEHCTVQRGAREGSVAKSYLVSRLQRLLGTGALLLPEIPEARALASELEDFWRDVNAQANAIYGAKVGSHDDLVCALGLSVLLDRPIYRTGSVRYA